MKRKFAWALLPIFAWMLVACGGAGKEEVIKTTPEEILKTYQNGATAGDQRFKGKKVEVTGVIAETDITDNGIPYLTFALDNEVLPVFNFKKDQAKAVASLKSGAKVTLNCIGAGELIRTPAFKDCMISVNVQSSSK